MKTISRSLFNLHNLDTTGNQQSRGHNLVKASMWLAGVWRDPKSYFIFKFTAEVDLFKMLKIQFDVTIILSSQLLHYRAFVARLTSSTITTD